MGLKAAARWILAYEIAKSEG